MKFNCDKSDDRKTKWHLWFAWHSVKVGPNDCRWLEYVERKGLYSMTVGWIYSYREVEVMK